MLQLPDSLIALRNMRENNLSQTNIPLLLGNYIPREVHYTPPSLDIIHTFLEQKNGDAALKNLKVRIFRTEKAERVDVILVKKTFFSRGIAHWVRIG